MNDYKELVEMLRDMSRAIIRDDSIELGIAEELITDVDADACNDAADAIEQLIKERNFLKASLELERDMHELTKIERDEANIRAEHKCDTCKNNFNGKWRGVRDE